MQVWKAPLMLQDEQAIFLPFGAKILSVDLQHEEICIWYLCTPSAQLERRTILIRGTGQDIDPFQKKEFLGTVLMNSGSLVWHVFEGK